MKIQRVTGDPTTTKTPWLCLGLFEDRQREPDWLWNDSSEPILNRLIESKDLSRVPGDLTILHGLAGFEADSILLVGLGNSDQFHRGIAFDAGVAIGKRLSTSKRSDVSIGLPEPMPSIGSIEAMVQGVITGVSGPGLVRSEPNRYEFESLSIITPSGSDEESGNWDPALRRAEIIGRSINLARELANLPPDQKPPRLLADRIETEARAVGVEVDRWELARIQSERLGGLLGVASGSDEPPVFLRLEWRGAPESPETVTALIGKGVTFDSGGLSLKSTSSMEDMKADMSGAAIVASTLVAVARLGLSVNVRAYLPITENMNGGRAMKLGDVLRIRNGKTVEVMNTDAEGRLILADALCLAAEERPTRMIDLATLTGSCVVALGQKIAGLFSNDDETAALLEKAGAETGERLWRLPMDPDFKDLLKSHVADLKNVGGKWGGASTAAKFLEQFCGEIPWAHLDIAGPSWVDAETINQDPGATGCFVRTLVTMLDPSNQGV